MCQRNISNTSMMRRRKVGDVRTLLGYSGTGILTKVKPIAVHADLGIPKHDKEGRTITA